MSLPKRVNRLIGQAMHTYDMLADGDRVMIGVSGGVDSLFLVWLLDYWRRKAPIDFEIFAVHLDMGFVVEQAHLVEEKLRLLEVPFIIINTTFSGGPFSPDNNDVGCFHCARTRRNRLFEFAREKNFSKIALGHHKDDIIETFFFNMLYSGNLSTMVPRQDLFDGALSIIRPLAFLDKEQIREAAARMHISPVRSPCPHAHHSRRQTVRTLLDSIYRMEPNAKAGIFASLSNLKPDYMLKRLKVEA